MKFTLKEWNFIKHCIEVAKKQFEKEMDKSVISYNETSLYQIWKRSSEEAEELINKIEKYEI